MCPGPQKKYSSLLAVRLEPEMRKLLENLAEREERTASQMARILLRNAIKEWEKKKPRRGKV
jgi:predicted DNA-binding protein